MPIFAMGASGVMMVPAASCRLVWALACRHHEALLTHLPYMVAFRAIHMSALAKSKITRVIRQNMAMLPCSSDARRQPSNSASDDVFSVALAQAIIPFSARIAARRRSSAGISRSWQPGIITSAHGCRVVKLICGACHRRRACICRPAARSWLIFQARIGPACRGSMAASSA